MSITLPPIPAGKLNPSDIRARDIEVARVVLERAAQKVALHVWHSEECQSAINAIRALKVSHDH